MESSVIFISDSDENDELPSLNNSTVTVCSDFDECLPSSKSTSKLEIKIENDIQAGKPGFTSSCVLSSSERNPCSASFQNVANATPVAVINLSSDEDEDFDMQRAISNSLQSIAPAMGCPGQYGGYSKKRQHKLDVYCPKTWSQRRAEHMAHRGPASKSHVSALPSKQYSTPKWQMSDSPIKISSDSGAEDTDTLPDLDDTLPDLDLPYYVGYQDPRSKSTPKHTSMTISKPNRERHFLDSFQPPKKTPKIKDTELTQIKEIGKSKMTECKSLNETKAEQPKRHRISQEMQAGSVPVYQENYPVFTFPLDKSSKSTPERRTSTSDLDARLRVKNKFIGLNFLQDRTSLPSVTDRLCSDFVRLQTLCLDDLLDDLGHPTQFANCIDLLQDFCSKRKPPQEIMEKIIINGFFRNVDNKITTQTYQLMLKVWQQFPDLIKLDTQLLLICGDILQKHLQNSVSTSASSRSAPTGRRGGRVMEKPNVQQSKLYFQLFVKGLQLNLTQCTLADPKSVNKSVAFVHLSSENSKPLVKQLTHWLEFCLVVRHQQHMAMAQAWMGQLQTLLDVCVLVSRDRQETAKKLAPELKRTYKYLTDLSAKKQLLQSFSSPLLCFYVLRLVVEDQCENTIVSSQFPSSIQEIIHNYYVALPPHDHLTPPPSPSENGEEERGVVRRHSQLFSVQACEELAMLIFYISKSFIACKQRRLYSDLRQQILKGPSAALTEEQKRQFQHSIHEFSRHLQTLCTELSPATKTYLTLLDCLCLSK